MRPLRRVVLFGTESTGKTVLARRLASHFGAPWSAEFVREFWDAHGGRIGPLDLEAIAHGQVAAEERAVAAAREGLVLHDTNLLTCVLWNDVLFPEACPAWVRAEAEARARAVDLFLLCDADVPFEPDPQRCFPEPERREWARGLWRDALVSRGLPFTEVAGPWAVREARAVAAVAALLAS